jgi:GT2 family glycosyltransferase
MSKIHHSSLREDYISISDFSNILIPGLTRDYCLPELERSILSIQYASDYAVDRNVRRYLYDTLQTGTFEIVSPFSGEAAAAEFSIVLKDKTTFVFFDNFIVGLGHLGMGFPIMALIIPEKRLFIKILDDFWGVQERHLIEVAAVLQNLPSSTVSTKTELWLVSGDANFAHHAWNQLSSLQAISESGLSHKKFHLVSTHEPLGPIDSLFPELAHWDMRRVMTWELENINRLDRLVLPIGGDRIPKTLVERIVKTATVRRHTDKIANLLERLERSEGPVLWMSIRTRNRTATNQVEMLTEIAREFLSEYGSGHVILDGHSYMEDVASNLGYDPVAQRAIVDDDESTANQIITGLAASSSPVDKILVAVGLPIGESIVLAQKADFYFCHHGTVQHKIGWFTSRVGVVHCNRRTTEVLPALYVQDQSEMAGLPVYVPLELIEAPEPNPSEANLEQVLKTENYRFIDKDAVRDLTLNLLRKNVADRFRCNAPNDEISSVVNDEEPQLQLLESSGTGSATVNPLESSGTGSTTLNPSGTAWPRLAAKLTAGLMRLTGRTHNLTREIEASGLFDWKFYTFAYTDVPSDPRRALQHFSTIGISQARHPNLTFNPREYVSDNPDVGSASGAFLHYIRFGKNEGRHCEEVPARIDFESTATLIEQSGLFDRAIYAERVPVVAEHRWNPSIHYLIVGARKGIEPLSDYSMNRYLALYPDVRSAGTNPLVHWLISGSKELRTLPSYDDEPEWVDASRVYSLPDDVVNLDLTAGRAFFSSFDFSFTDREHVGLHKQCVHWLSKQVLQSAPPGASPKVSVVIPVYGQLDYVLNCLDSLRTHKTNNSFEIIVCDDASPEHDQISLLKQIPWVRYIHREKNGGFIECCNSAAGEAKGEIIVFLNSDTRVVDSWLDELVWSFKNLNAGIVGSKLINADGTLQEAGGIIFNDGSGYNYGRGNDSNDPRYCYARQVDYISGASIAIISEIWRKIGGFDKHYAPAYCEDVDIAFKVRELGYGVWYQPFSRVIHYEGITHGRNIHSGIKAYQTANLKKLFDRYRSKIAEHATLYVSPDHAATREQKKLMLVIDALTPAPDQDSGSVMTFEVMRTYRELGFTEHFLPAHHPFWSKKYSTDLQRRGVCCHYHPFSPSIITLAERARGFDLALIYRHEVASIVYEDVRELMPVAPVIFANVDLHYLRESRGAETTGDKHALARAEITKSSELKMFAQADASFVHTKVERDIIQHELPAKVDNIVVFPWLAEAADFSNPFEERSDVMFLGNFPHTPNVDSILYFMECIWPDIEKRLPDNARLLIVGNKPPIEVMALASPRIVVTGFVEDLGPYFSTSKVFVAPLRYGAGIKGKIVNSFAHGVPCVATKVAAEGIAGDKDSHVIVQDDPKLFADEVVRLYTDEDRWNLVQREGLAFLEKNYSRSRAATLCGEAFDIATEVWKRRQQYKRSMELRRLMLEQGDIQRAAPEHPDH